MLVALSTVRPFGATRPGDTSHASANEQKGDEWMRSEKRKE
jgi:hypothetical protein